MNNTRRFTTQSLSRAHFLSLVISLSLAAVSLMGLLLPDFIYPTEELRRAFLSNDAVNLLIGLPVLIAAPMAARRGSLPGLLFWPGALFYVTYNSVAYAVAMPFTMSFVINVALVILSAAVMVILLSSLDGCAVQAHLKGKTPERYIAGTLIGFGALFFVMAAGKVAGYFNGQVVIPWTEVSVQIADLLITPWWVVGGVLLWRKQPLGYISAAGLLFQASMLFAALLLFFILRPLVAGLPFPMEDFIVIAVMGLFCFIPFGLFLRGAWMKG